MTELYENIKNGVIGLRFEDPWNLTIIILFLILFIYVYKRRLPTLKIPWIKPFAVKSKKRSKRIYFIPIYLYFLAFIFFIIALARPQMGMEELKQRADGIDIILALDLSGSMKAIDIPRNATQHSVSSDLRTGKIGERITIAKNEIRKFILKRSNDRIGLIVFAPLPYVACPPTLDHSWLLAHLDNVDAGVIGDATGIAAPLASAVSRLKDSDSKRRVVVLFTDGSNNVDARISPQQAAKIAKTFDIIIYTVGIGSNNAYVLHDGPFGSQFVPLKGQFDEGLLKKIAKTTGGKYYKAADSVGLQKVMGQIDKLEKTSIETPKFIDYREIGPLLAMIGLGILLLGFILENTLFIRIP